MKEKIENLIREALNNLNIKAEKISVEHPADLKMGDFSTSIAMGLSKELKNSPQKIADGILNEINNVLSLPADESFQRAKIDKSEIEKIEVAGSGFINFYLSRKFFVDSIGKILESRNYGENDLLKDQKIMVEYTDANPFKPFHIGHLMSNAIGESISRIVEFSGAEVIRANYQGDIGPHVAKSVYGLLRFGLPREEKSISEKAQYIGEVYAKGNELYESDTEVKREIDEINIKIYERSDKKINEIYDWGRRVTLEAFEEIYKILGTNFNYYFFESIVAPIGGKIVRENPKIFEKSEGATVFYGQSFDPKLHTRVFINSQGLPTYEAKELGLTFTKFEKEDLSLSIVVTAHEQEEYMKVVTKALELIRSDISSKMKHIVHGMMRLSSGKISSRKGNVVTGGSLILDSCSMILEKIKEREFSDDEKRKISQEVGVGALKYSILKQNIGGDIIFDFEKSISFEGDSGPYLQYTYARTFSLLEKAEKEKVLPSLVFERENSHQGDTLVSEVEKLLYRFPEIVLKSAEEYSPHYIANFLIELVRAFNSFYGHTRIIDSDDPLSSYRVAVVKAFSLVLENGLYLLGIKAPQKM